MTILEDHVRRYRAILGAARHSARLRGECVLAAGSLIAGVAFAAISSDAAAQVPGLPVHFEPQRSPPGIDHGLLYVIGSADVDGATASLSWLVAGRVRLASGVTIQTGAGLRYPEDEDGGRSARAQLGANAELLVATLPVTIGIVGGVGYAASGADSGVIVAPVGLALAHFFGFGPQSAGPKLGLWAMPRAELQHRYAQAPGDASHTALGWGGAAGVSLGTGARVGLNVGFDARLYTGSEEDPLLFPEVTAWSFGILLRYWL